MQVRHVPARQGLAWFRDAINLGSRNPKAVFGAALLLIGAMYLFVVVLGLAATLFGRGQGAAASGALMGVAAVMTLALMMLMPILLGGLMHVIREVEAGRPARATDLFAPFKSGRLPQLATLGVLQVVVAIVFGLLLVSITGTDYVKEYMAAMRDISTLMTMPEPRHPILLFVLQVGYNYFTYVAMLLAVPLVLFSRVSVMDAVRGALRASVSNVAPNLLAAVLFVLGTVVAVVVVVLVAVLLGALGALVHPIVGGVLSSAVLLAFGTALLVVLAGGSYFAWRDTFEGEGMPPPPFRGIEA
ncbi:hypothetical protein LYSHEL_12120 [Lysobacter helvus]|uniref:Transmembrane protein n=2 Tax=Lysobacteraceae TaxID=32033 RepID=A0ABN6FX00_9GAMM|nr:MULTISPECIES: BPSS1780 family membrane protein [Lysobacter]BCT92188.1 hypothetical protein LYSCAS_12120 [Lysobacter caseinilyticus]BCT95341.1 hypothetical protein LYSHEL_12120 [Lysobacter helvus]